MVPIAFQHTVLAGQEHITPDVELPFIVQKRFIYIFLDNVSVLASIFVLSFFLNDIFNVYYVIFNRNSAASIGVFARFYDKVWFKDFVFFNLFEMFYKTMILLVIFLIAYMEGHWYIIIRIFINHETVMEKIVKERFFICNMHVLIYMIMTFS